jgi:peptidyl-tRNA hydrolase
VLGRFSKAERPAVDRLVERAADAAEEWAGAGIEPAMNRYN